MKLFLHIGHGKTGSSFLQSAYALTPFSKLGIHYPIDDDIRKRAKNGDITSGNFNVSAQSIAKLLDDAKNQGFDKLLLSNELLFSAILQSGNNFFDKFKQSHPDVEINILLLTRNPLDHAVSSYQQKIKRGGYTGSLAEFLKTYDMPSKVNKVIAIARNAGATVTLKNYSTHRSGLLAIVENWLNIPESGLIAPSKRVINRSLSAAELEFQRVFNEIAGKASSKYISDPLCQQLPNIKSEFPPLETDALESFLARMNDSVYAAQQGCAEFQNEQYTVGDQQSQKETFPTAKSQLSFSSEQIRVMASAMARFRSRRQS
jgi:hypothetical protein